MRGFRLGLAAVLLGGLVLAADEKPRTVKFSKDDTDRVPAGWKADKTGKGEGSVWKVVADDTAPSQTGYALAQTAESPGNVFNIASSPESVGEFWLGEVTEAVI